MAIDTAARRRSAAGVGFFIVGPGVTPDATPDQFWRQSAAWSYGGILAGGAPVFTGQSPRPSRYRTGHRVTHYHPVLLLAAWLAERMFR
jgi:hypothetical protein